MWRVVDEVTKSNAGVLLKAAAGAAADQSLAAVKNASNAGVKATGGAILNAGVWTLTMRWMIGAQAATMPGGACKWTTMSGSAPI